jgi:HSP20 family protein
MRRLLDEFAFAVPSPGSGTWTPPADIELVESGVVLTMEVPGVAQEDVEVRVDGRTLTICGERHKDVDEQVRFLAAERAMGRFRRSFAMPWALDGERVEAQLERGVLTVRVPRAAGHKVPVEGE